MNSNIAGKLQCAREICFMLVYFFYKIQESWEPLKVENSWTFLLYRRKKKKYEDM